MLMLPSIEYNKKPGKPATIKVVKDNAVPRDDIYKSGTIHTGQGEPPNSISRPTPKGKPKSGRPITTGKLLRPGGPGGGPSKLAARPAASRPVPQNRALPGQPATSQPRPVPQLLQPAAQSRPVPQLAVQSRSMPHPVAAQSRPFPQPIPTMNGGSHSRTDSTSSINRAPPPPPPGPPPAKQKDTYRALYDFAGQSAIELTLQKNEIIEVVQKADNGNPFLISTMTGSDVILSFTQAGGSARSSTDPIKRGPPPPTLSPKHPNPHLHRRRPAHPYLSPTPP